MKFHNKGAGPVQIAPLWIGQPLNQNQAIQYAPMESNLRERSNKSLYLMLIAWAEKSRKNYGENNIWNRILWWVASVANSEGEPLQTQDLEQRWGAEAVQPSELYLSILQLNAL